MCFHEMRTTQNREMNRSSKAVSHVTTASFASVSVILATVMLSMTDNDHLAPTEEAQGQMGVYFAYPKVHRKSIPCTSGGGSGSVDQRHLSPPEASNPQGCLLSGRKSSLQ